jgi:hypothetical protein
VENEWKEHLEAFFKERNRGLAYTREHAREFFDYTVAKAFSSLQGELEEYGNRVQTTSSATGDSLFVLTSDDDASFIRWKPTFFMSA